MLMGGKLFWSFTDPLIWANGLGDGGPAIQGAFQPQTVDDYDVCRTVIAEQLNPPCTSENYLRPC